MHTQYVTAGSGEATTTPFALGNRGPFAVSVASLGAAGPIGLEFTENSGSAPFRTLTREDGTALPFQVHSGIGQAIGIVPRAPTPWGRLTLPSAGQVSSFTILPIVH
jgi:hypothetical protein